MDPLFSGLQNVNQSAANMERSSFSGGDRNTFLSSLAEFCSESLSTCLSHGADKLCVPIGLCALSALLLLLSCALLLNQRCRFRRENPGENFTFLYSLLGNLCSTVAAILSRQLHIQVLMGAVAAAVDAVHFISLCLLVLLCWNSKAERRLRMMRGRRRQQQHLLAVCVLMVVAGGFLKSRVTHEAAEGPLSRRRLLQDSFEDITEILGYLLGLLSFVIACTSRFPALCRAHRGQILTRAHMFSGLLCSLAGAFYAAAILFYNTQFGFLLRVMPWLLSATCCVTLDLLILVIHWCRRGARQPLTSFSMDTERLLGDSHILAEDKAVVKKQRKQQVHPSAQRKATNVQKMTELGRYMDVHSEPARHMCLSEVISEEEEEVENQPLNGKVRIIKDDSFCSSDSSTESSPVSSDLEWDFEEASARWREPATKQQFLPQEWPRNPKPFNICTGATSGLSHETLPGKEEGKRA